MGSAASEVFLITRVDGRSVTMAWYLDQPRHQQKNDGNSCFYCYATFAARYKHKKMSMKQAQSIAVGVSGPNPRFIWIGLRGG